MKQIFTKLFLLSILLALSASVAVAAHIPSDAAAKIAENFLKAKNTPQIKSASHSAAFEIKELTKSEAYYVFGMQNNDNGFVIISAEDSLEPVVGYSPEGKFDPRNIPDGLKAYLSDYEKVVKAISAGEVSYCKATRGGEEVAPFLNVRWNQGEPYNRMTPLYGSEHTPTGCVATAVAQVMKHYQFPAAGKGTAGSEYGNNVELGHPYEWSKMLDSYEYDYSDEQGDAVALLMRDVGFALNMNYGQYESSAYSQGILATMVRNFNYSKDMVYADRSSYSTAAWTDLIRSSLKEGKPVLYSGNDGVAGHQFVCDGIDTDDMLHINWGWGGYGDGYFDMNILSPDYLGIGAGNGSYYRDQDIVAFIAPGEPDADYTEWKAPMYVFGIALTGASGEDNKVTEDTYFEFNVGNSTGIPIDRYEYASALKVCDDDGNLIGLYYGQAVSNMGINQYLIRRFYLLGVINEMNLPDGHYNLSVTVITDNDRYNLEQAKPLPVYSGDLNNIGFTIKGSEAFIDMSEKVTNPENVKITDLKVGKDNKIYIGTSNTFHVTIQNNSTGYFSKSCYIYLLPKEFEDEQDLSKATYLWTEDRTGDLYLYPGVTSEVSVKTGRTPENPGIYRIYLVYADNYQDKIIQSDEPYYVEILSLPDDDVLMTTPLTLEHKEYPRSAYQYISTVVSCYNPFSRFNTVMELWASPKDNEDEPEILILRMENVRLSNGINNISIAQWSETNAFWYGSLGKYTAYFKFKDPQGNVRIIPGENNLTEYTLTPCEDEEQLIMASPMVVNGGNPVTAEYWKEFDIEFEVMSPTGVILDPERSSANINRVSRADDYVYSFFTSNVTVDKTELAPGESTKVHIDMVYRTYDGEEDVIGKTVFVDVFFSTKDSFCWVQPDKFEKSMNFSLVAKEIIEMTGFTLNYTDYTGKPGDKFYLSPIVEPENAETEAFYWVSSNPSVASVSEMGYVQLWNEGTAVITAYCGPFTATCTITSSLTSGIEDIILDGNTDVTIFNTQGIEVFAGKYADAQLNPGVYMIRLTDGKIKKCMIR